LTEPLQVGQFAIVDGEPVDRGPNAGKFHGKGPTDDRAELFIVAEGTTPAGEAFAGHVVSGAGHSWAAMDMSLTGALQRLFEEAAANLRDWNRKSIAQHRVSIGLTAFARRGTQAVVAQAGPSVAFHRSGNRVQAYYADEEHGQPIGSGPATTPQLTRVDFAPGDRLLLLSTAALQEIDDEIIEGILLLPAEQVLPNLYHRLEHLRNLTAMLVTNDASRASALVETPEGFVIDATGASGEAAARPPTSTRDAVAGEAMGAEPPLQAGTYQPSLFIKDRSEDAVEAARQTLVAVTARIRPGTVALPEVAAHEMPPLRRAAGDNALARLAAEHHAHSSMSHAGSHAGVSVATMPGHGSSRPSWRSAPPPAASTAETMSAGPNRDHRRESFFRGLVREEAPPRPEPNPDDLPFADELAAGLSPRAAHSGPVSETIAGDNAASMAGGGSLVRVRAGMSGRWKGDGTLSRRRPVAQGHFRPTWLVVIVGIVLLLGVVGLITLPRLLGGDSTQQYTALVDSAQQKLATARVLEDPSEKRKALTEAQALLLEARDASASGPEAAQLISQVTAALAAMDAVRTPTAVDVVASLDQFGDKPVAAVRLEVTDDTAYVLDGASGQVIALPLKGGEHSVVYGEDKDAKRGRPVATAFLEGADLGEPSLLIMDASRNLWAFSPTAGLRPVPFGAPASMTVTDIAVYGRDLFVLDAAASAVYKFSPGDGGYGAAPVKVLDTPDIAAARRLMVDSEIVTADANGTLRRFTGQLALVLSEAGVDQRLVRAEAPAALTRNGDLAVLDSANDRIVVLRRDGAFDRQYRHKDFQAMSAFTLHKGVPYVFSGGKLRRVTW